MQGGEEHSVIFTMLYTAINYIYFSLAPGKKSTLWTRHFGMNSEALIILEGKNAIFMTCLLVLWICSKFY